jgi:hypothetical protein
MVGGQPLEDCPSRGIGECRKGGIELVDEHPF